MSSTTYEPAPKYIEELVRKLLNKFYPEIVESGLKIDLLYAHPPEDKNGQPTGPAIKAHGYCAAAQIRVVNLRDRAKGNRDCEILIDSAIWNNMDEEERLATLDHELYHITLKHKVDDMGRPKIGLRLHDRQHGWFDKIAHRYGKHSWEMRQFSGLLESYETYFQGEFELLTPPKQLPAPEPAAAA